MSPLQRKTLTHEPSHMMNQVISPRNREVLAMVNAKLKQNSIEGIKNNFPFKLNFFFWNMELKYADNYVCSFLIDLTSSMISSFAE